MCVSAYWISMHTYTLMYTECVCNSERSEVPTRGLLRFCQVLGVAFASLLKICSGWPTWLWPSHHHQLCSNMVFYSQGNLHSLGYDSLLVLGLPRGF